jgi:hypothetical protein
MTKSDKPPYLTSPGTLAKVLDKIKQAATPPRFTQDFLKNKLQFKSSNAALVIPYLKKIGFLGTDGTPTEMYARFRNPSESGRAVAEALRTGYRPLFEINEQAHQLKDEELKGLIVQLTGQTKEDTVTKLIFSCFKVLKERANLQAVGAVVDQTKEEPDDEDGDEDKIPPKQLGKGIGMNLAYTINLNLPATTDIAVFNAIFQSLRKNLLRDE